MKRAYIRTKREEARVRIGECEARRRLLLILRMRSGGWTRLASDLENVNVNVNGK
jgi:hypothetical protein